MENRLQIPIILFVYNRPDILSRTLEAIRQNNVPLLYIFSDGPRNSKSIDDVQAVRNLIHQIDWTETHIIERKSNYGLGHSIIAGVSEVLKCHEAVVVFEDDLVCVPGTYQYFVDALHFYRYMTQVMSITAWNNTELIPSDTTDSPYFDGRAESWGWATWQRAWNGMETVNAMQLLREYRHNNGDIRRYGEDVPAMCLMEAERNLWLVRWIMWHLVQGGLCLRPPKSMINHIGYTHGASNALESEWLQDDQAESLSIALSAYPEPVEHSECARLWRSHRWHYWQRVPFISRMRALFGYTRRMIRHRFLFLPTNDISMG